MKDCKGDTGGKAGEGEDDVGDDVQDGELCGAPVTQSSACVKDQTKVGQVVAHALRLHLVAPLAHHLWRKIKKQDFQHSSILTFSFPTHLATLITPKLQRRIPKDTVRKTCLARLQKEKRINSYNKNPAKV